MTVSEGGSFVVRNGKRERVAWTRPVHAAAEDHAGEAGDGPDQATAAVTTAPSRSTSRPRRKTTTREPRDA
ncbi:MAG: hypothetical protein WDM94_09235 [Bauldia sp.]